MTHPQAAEPRRRRNAKATRDRLVRAALDLFTTQGYHGSTTPQIAARAGVAEGTIYRHFASKEQLFNEIYRAGLRLFAGCIGRVDAGAPCGARLIELSREWQDLAARDPALVRLIFIRGRGDALDDRSRAAGRQFRSALEQQFADGKAAGDVRSGSVTTLAEIWIRLIALALERIAAGEWPPGHPTAQQITTSAWDAVRAQGGQAEANR